MIPTWLEKAIFEVGVFEYPGKKSNPRIKEYLTSVSDHTYFDDFTPWCSAFLCWVFNETGLVTPDTLVSRKWLKWGIKLDEPTLGCVTILKSPFHTWGGHVGLWIIESEESVLLLSGNSDNQVKFKLYPKSMILGHRWPKTLNKAYAEEGLKKVKKTTS